jgi:hypothetical protein
MHSSSDHMMQNGKKETQEGRIQPMEHSEQSKPQPEQPERAAHHQYTEALSAQRSSEPRPLDDLTSDEGLKRLGQDWLTLQVAQGKVDPEQTPTPNQRVAYLADWLRWLLTSGKLEQQKRLPPYNKLGALFGLNKKQVAQVINQLRAEGLLPKRKKRKDTDKARWTYRDNYLFWYIGHMRALRYDQARRLLTRLSEYEIESGLLSLTQSARVMERWFDKKYAVRVRTYGDQNDLIYLSGRGLRHAGLDFRAEAPSMKILDHLFWITEVRLKLEEENPRLEWISERSIQAQQAKRELGQRLMHIPDAIIVTEAELIDIEVQISRPKQPDVERIMRGGLWSQMTNPLRYYVNRHSRSVVLAAYRKIMQETRTIRPRIEVIDLEVFLKPSSSDQHPEPDG